MLIAAAFFSSVGADALAGLAVLIVGTIGAAWNSKRRKKKANFIESEEEREQADADMLRLVQQMHTALVGDEPSPFNPNPTPGLVKTVPELLRRTERIEHTLYTNGGKGNTIVDRMERMEGALKQGNKNIVTIKETQDRETTPS